MYNVPQFNYAKGNMAFMNNRCDFDIDSSTLKCMFLCCFLLLLILPLPTLIQLYIVRIILCIILIDVLLYISFLSLVVFLSVWYLILCPKYHWFKKKNHKNYLSFSPLCFLKSKSLLVRINLMSLALNITSYIFIRGFCIKPVFHGI